MENKDVIDTSTTEIAILMDDHVNKYRPGVQTFRLQSISGLKDNTRDLDTIPVKIPQLMNKEAPNFQDIKMASVIKLDLPREVTRNYPKKFIPVGTRFVVSFNSGDITKPVIVGREEEGES